MGRTPVCEPGATSRCGVAVIALITLVYATIMAVCGTALAFMGVSDLLADRRIALSGPILTIVAGIVMLAGAGICVWGALEMM